MQNRADLSELIVCIGRGLREIFILFFRRDLKILLKLYWMITYCTTKRYWYRYNKTRLTLIILKSFKGALSCIAAHLWLHTHPVTNSSVKFTDLISVTWKWKFGGLADFRQNLKQFNSGLLAFWVTDHAVRKAIYISCYITESRLPLGQCSVKSDIIAGF